MLRLIRLMILTFLATVRARFKNGPLRPSWSFSFEATVRFLRRDWDETSAWSLPRLRAELDARPYPRDVLRRVTVRDGELGGVPARWFVPPGPSGMTVLFFHGGSYIYGSARTTHADALARIALASGATVIGVDYRLAPEHVYPAQLEDAERAFEALLATTSVEHVIVAGDSAGGNLALSLELARRDRGAPLPRACVLICPWSDLTMPGRSFVENEPFDFGTREALLRHARAFAGELALEDPRLSPVNARLGGLTPVLVVAGEVEIPRDDILALAAALEKANVDVTVHVAPDLPHNPPLFAAYHPEARACVEAIGAFVRRFG
jgi:acetyl esterase/lipase